MGENDQKSIFFRLFLIYWTTSTKVNILSISQFIYALQWNTGKDNIVFMNSCHINLRIFSWLLIWIRCSFFSWYTCQPLSSLVRFALTWFYRNKPGIGLTPVPVSSETWSRSLFHFVISLLFPSVRNHETKFKKVTQLLFMGPWKCKILAWIQ